MSSGQSNPFAVPVFFGFWLVVGCLLIIGTWRQWKWPFDMLEHHRISRFLEMGTGQAQEYRKLFNYLLGAGFILLGLVGLFLLD